MKSETIQLYEEKPYVTLTTYLTGLTGELSGQGKRPAVIVCPGGAYLSCSDREAEPVALQFAMRGYHAFVLRYSVYSDGVEEIPDIFATLEAKPENCHPAPVRDIAKAMLYIREHAEEWMVDMDRVAVCGFSAGGHNAAMYSVYWDKPVVTEYFGVDAAKLRPAAAILGYPLTDYTFMSTTQMNPMDRKFFENSNTIFLGEAYPSEERLEEISPAHLVTENTPPTFIWATAADNLVPVQHSIRMAHALADHKIPFEIHIFEQGDHGLSVGTQASAVSQTQLNADVAKWTSLAGDWLMKRFALELPKMTPFEEMMAANGNPGAGNVF